MQQTLPHSPTITVGATTDCYSKESSALSPRESLSQAIHHKAMACLDARQVEEYLPRLAKCAEEADLLSKCIKAIGLPWSAMVPSGFIAAGVVNVIKCWDSVCLCGNRFHRRLCTEQDHLDFSVAMCVPSLVLLGFFVASYYRRNTEQNQKLVQLNHACDELSQRQQLTHLPQPLGPHALRELFNAAGESALAVLAPAMNFEQQLYAAQCLEFATKRSCWPPEQREKMDRLAFLASSLQQGATTAESKVIEQLYDSDFQKQCQADPVFRWAVYEQIKYKALPLKKMQLDEIYLPWSSTCQSTANTFLLCLKNGEEIFIDRALVQRECAYFSDEEYLPFDCEKEVLIDLLQIWEGKRALFSTEELISLLKLAHQLCAKKEWITHLEWLLIDSNFVTPDKLQQLLDKGSQWQQSEFITSLEDDYIRRVYRLLGQESAKKAFPVLLAYFQAACLNVKINLQNYCALLDIAEKLDFPQLRQDCQNLNYEKRFKDGLNSGYIDGQLKSYLQEAMPVFALRTKITFDNVYNLFQLTGDETVKQNCREFCAAHSVEIITHFSNSNCLRRYDLKKIFSSELRESMINSVDKKQLSAAVVQQLLRQDRDDLVEDMRAYLLRAISEENLSSMWQLAKISRDTLLQKGCKAFCSQYNLPLLA